LIARGKTQLSTQNDYGSARNACCILLSALNAAALGFGGNGGRFNLQLRWVQKSSARIQSEGNVGL
jgi:hypothetical protein